MMVYFRPSYLLYTFDFQGLKYKGKSLGICAEALNSLRQEFKILNKNPRYV